MKKVLVTGGTGMIGRYLVPKLLSKDYEVFIASLDGEELCPEGANFRKLDLRNFDNCLSVCRDMDEVYHLAGVKGSPKMCREQPADFFVPTITFSLNMMEAARICGVDKYLYTSSVGVYHPADIFNEDDVWRTFPSENDKFAGWAKRMGELQAEAYLQQYKKGNYCIVRPGNVYGRFDNFDPDNAMVIPSLIARIYSGENPLKVWGNGKPIRDFIHADDVASAMIFVMENNINIPVNVSSGHENTIKSIVEIISESFDHIDYEFTNEGPSGDNKRLMNVSRLKSYGWKPNVGIKDGINDTVKWYIAEGHSGYQRYNAFKEKN